MKQFLEKFKATEMVCPNCYQSFLNELDSKNSLSVKAKELEDIKFWKSKHGKLSSNYLRFKSNESANRLLDRSTIYFLELETMTKKEFERIKKLKNKLFFIKVIYYYKSNGWLKNKYL